jgi:hypothetical protein
MLATILFMLAQVVTAQGTGSPGNLSEDLYYASIGASGTKLCDRHQAARYTRQFDKRYGKRIRALIQYHESRFGKDPDFIFTTDCRRSLAPMREQDRYHRQAMDAYDARLRALEQRYGPPAQPRPSK